MRKLLAVWAAKLASVAGLLVGKKSSSTPGAIALKICPDLIRILSKELTKGVICTCGTNGKTTTNNLLNSALKQCGYTTVCNDLGANMLSGVAAAFAKSCNLFGKLRGDWAVLEIDEAFARKVFAHLTPNYMVVTNLFRDQLDRYGEIDTTMALLREAIAMHPNLTLILNGDDPLSSQFGEGRRAYYYGISEQVLPQSDNMEEGRFCAKCGKEQHYHFTHYNQLGDYYCPHCGNKRPQIDFSATDVDLSGSMKFTVNHQVPIHVNYRGFYNIYNILAVYSALQVMGITNQDFNAILSDYKPQIGRMELIDLGKPFILNLAKNPAGFNQAIQTVMLDKRRKDVIVAINATANDGKDLSWLWDANFDQLADENLNRLYVSGVRRHDLALRFRYADIPVERICDSVEEALKLCLTTDAEVCYVLVNYSVLFSTQSTMLELQKNLPAGGEA
ncbi:MAG: DUF1727 domain-containing protein [Clostridia bacterium]|nr:DUF1727 domain-containing protein [Clostridia bacterium]